MMNKKSFSTDNYIELKETVKHNTIHITAEESRKIIPTEVKNLKIIASSQVIKYTWEEEGEKIITSTKLCFSREEKKILRSLLLEKLPEKFRQNLWLIASGARREMLNNPNYYQNLTANFPDHVPSPFENQIEVDLERTFPDEDFFNDKRNIAKLRNVLLAYSRRNITIGYCQGFNFIVARLLMVYEKEEEAFWVFVQLIEHVLPLNYYSDLAGIMVDCTILLQLLKVYLPALIEHLSSIGFEVCLSNILYKWFVSLFTQSISYELHLTIWDLLFSEGSIVLFKSAIGILKIMKNDLIAKDSMEDLNILFEENTKYLNDVYTMRFYIMLRRFEFDSDFISMNRELFMPKVLETIKKANEYKLKRYAFNRRNSLIKDTIECHRDWPLCLNDCSFRADIPRFFVFRILNEPILIENYFFNQCPYANRRIKVRKWSDKKKETRGGSAEPTEGKFQYAEIVKKRTVSHEKDRGSKDIQEVKSMKIKLYQDLLIERRPHLCVDKMKDIEICRLIAIDQEILDESGIDIRKTIEKNHVDLIKEKKLQKSNSLVISSYFDLDEPTVDQFTYNNILGQSEITKEQQVILESLKPKTLIEMEEEAIYYQDEVKK